MRGGQILPDRAVAFSFAASLEISSRISVRSPESWATISGSGPRRSWERTRNPGGSGSFAAETLPIKLRRNKGTMTSWEEKEGPAYASVDEPTCWKTRAFARITASLVLT